MKYSSLTLLCLSSLKIFIAYAIFSFFYLQVLIKDNEAIGVQFDYENETYEVKARREVILSAGTIKTAQLLKLSGIGPRKELERFHVI